MKNKQQTVGITIVFFSIVLALTLTNGVIAEETEERIEMSEDTFKVLTSGNGEEVPVIDGNWYQVGEWKFKALEYDPQDELTFRSIDFTSFGVSVYDTLEESERLIPVTLCLYDPRDLSINYNLGIEESTILSETASSTFCPEADKAFHEFISISSGEELVLEFSEHPVYIEVWTGEGAGGGANGLPVCEGMDLDIDTNQTIGNHSFSFDMELKGLTIGASSIGCSVDKLYWQTNQTGMWRTIPANNNLTLPLDCQGQECTRLSNNSVNTWYSKSISCDMEGETYIRGYMVYDHGGNPGLTTSSQIKKITCAANETEGRNAIIEGINNTIPNATVYTDQQVYIVYDDGSQKVGTFDKVAIEEDQVWLLNYVTPGEIFNSFIDLLTTVITWEDDSLTADQIAEATENLITTTNN